MQFEEVEGCTPQPQCGSALPQDALQGEQDSAAPEQPAEQLPVPKTTQPHMRITDLRLRDFRSYSDFDLREIGDLTIFVGKNGAGKTNVLESIALMTATSSFRHAQIGQLIKDGAEKARVCAETTDGNRRLSGELLLEPGKKHYSVNGKAKKAADIRGVLPAVSFIPDDLQLAKGSSSIKRDALDDLGIQVSANYYIVRRDYEKVLRYKNRLLKEEAPDALVQSINETLITCGSQLFSYRASLAARMLPLIRENYARISTDGGFAMSYCASWHHLQGVGELALADELPARGEVRELLSRALADYAADERARKRALAGPHNDKIEFSLHGRAVKDFASQGQQRSIVLAWKLAEVELIRQSLGVNPVLLLDDVMSELDADRRDMLVRFVTDDTQTFITATDLSAFNADLLDRARIVHIG